MRRGASIFGLPTISPTGYVVLVQLVVMGCLDASYTAFKVPISFAVTTNRTSWSLNNAVDLAAGSCPLLNNTGFRVLGIRV